MISYIMLDYSLTYITIMNTLTLFDCDVFIKKLKISENATLKFLLTFDPNPIPVTDISGGEVLFLKRETPNSELKISVPRFLVCREDSLRILVRAYLSYNGTETGHNLTQFLKSRLDIAVALHFHCCENYTRYLKAFDFGTPQRIAFTVLLELCKAAFDFNIGQLGEQIVSVSFTPGKRVVRTNQYVYTMENRVFSKQ